MKLTEQQLAQMFQNSKTDVAFDNVDLSASTDASDRRLTDVESIANSSELSASYHIINQLQDWSQAIGTDIQLSLKPSFVNNMFAWLRPTLATAAIMTTVYFVSPQLDNETNIQQKPDRIMFTSSFEGNNDVIKDLSFDSIKQPEVSDSISKNNFS